MSSEISMPCTSTPRAASGSAMRPVPTASSRTGPPPASAARKATAGSTAAGRESSPSAASYCSATRPTNTFCGTPHLDAGSARGPVDYGRRSGLLPAAAALQEVA